MLQVLHRLFTVYRKNPEILAGNFQSVKTVPVVYHLSKISESSRRARRDSSYNMNLVRNSRNEFPLGTSQSGKWDYLFRISVRPGNFQWDEPKKTFTIYIQPEFPGIRGKMVNNHKLVLFK